MEESEDGEEEKFFLRALAELCYIKKAPTWHISWLYIIFGFSLFLSVVRNSKKPRLKLKNKPLTGKQGDKGFCSSFFPLPSLLLFRSCVDAAFPSPFSYYIISSSLGRDFRDKLKFKISSKHFQITCLIQQHYNQQVYEPEHYLGQIFNKINNESTTKSMSIECRHTLTDLAQ